jgi:hypothetical protein
LQVIARDQALSSIFLSSGCGRIIAEAPEKKLGPQDLGGHEASKYLLPLLSTATMTDQAWIESAYSLVTLPAPLNRRIHASAVVSLAKGKKRKRTEVATAIDGEGINVYAVSFSI